MTHTLIVCDLATNQRLVFPIDAAQMAQVRQVWCESDFLLADMAKMRGIFSGRRHWCDLDAMHFRFMILRNVIRMTVLAEADRSDIKHPTVASLRFLAAALIHLLQTRTDSVVEVLKISINGKEAAFDYHASLDLAATAPAAPPPDLRVVVDNE